jgi:hypothetical protein
VKTKRKVIFGVLAVLGVVYVISIVPNFRRRAEWNRAVQALSGLPRERINSAVEAFTRAQKTQGYSVSNTVPLRELIAGGFLRADEVAPFGGMDVTFGVAVDDETQPERIIARVPLRNGAVAVRLGDGSVQMVSQATLDRQDQK